MLKRNLRNNLKSMINTHNGYIILETGVNMNLHPHIGAQHYSQNILVSFVKQNFFILFDIVSQNFTLKSLLEIVVDLFSSSVKTFLNL